MSTGLLLDTLFTEHETGPGHPESPKRLLAIEERLRADGLVEKAVALEKQVVTEDAILRVHTPDYLATVKREIDGQQRGNLSTGDTVYSEQSLEVAKAASGSAIAAVDAVVKGKVDQAFCALRPPGHHATADRGMGFCIFNHVAVAARHAQAELGLDRVAIIDWDVHHGNGTQDIFYDDPDVFYFSTHQHPWYPGTGLAHETGNGKGAGTTLNAPLPAGTDMADIGKAFREEFVPKMKDYKPDLVLISAGFDSRAGDPLGNFGLSDDDFMTLTGILMEIAGEFGEGRLVSLLEGGYALDGLASATSAHLRALMGESPG